MSMCKRRPWLVSGIVVALAASAAAGETSRAANGPKGVSGPRTRVLRSWQDAVKVNGVEVQRRVELIFDYSAGVAREVAYDRSGRLLGSVTIVHAQPAPSEEERTEAVDVMRRDPSLGRILLRTGAVPHGGFILEEKEGRPCGPRTRCLQVLLVSGDGRGLLRRVVVDLTKNAVVYRSYVPEETEVTK